jgi:hypothetical protein
MWELDNRTPFAATRGWVRDRDGAEVWLVIAKSTFAIGEQGALTPVEPQPPAIEMPGWNGEPGSSSLRFDLDLVRTKTTTDVLLLGHAYAPHGHPTQRVEVALRVGPVNKVLQVTGDRLWRVGPTGASMTDPEPFVKMPLIYEHAFGGADRRARPDGGSGWDARNPVGTGWAVSAAHLRDVRLPNIEYPNALICDWNDRPPPAGFGPICRHWDPRRRFGGTHDDAWQSTRFPLVPTDFDDRFFQCAPGDQLPPNFLQGGEQVQLSNLSPSGRLEFVLPRLDFAFATQFDGGAEEALAPAKLHSVILEPDYPRVSLVYHTSLPCHDRMYQLKQTRIELRGGLSYASTP